MIVDIATAADIAALADEIRGLRATVEALASRLPSQWLSLREAAAQMHVDARTVTAMCTRGELTFRMAGRRRLIDASSIRPPSREQVAAEVRAACRS